jgi:hypothetical protein
LWLVAERQLGCGKIAPIDLDHGDIGTRGTPDDSALDLLAVGEADDDGVLALDHMGGGEDEPVRVVDHAGANAGVRS